MNKTRRKLEKMLNPLRRNGSGQGALSIVLLLLLMGAVIIVPLLVFMQTGLRAGGVYESKMGEFYAADAGVEDALWWIRNAQPNLTEKFPSYDPYDYDTNYSYLLPDEMNNWNVTVSIANIWIPLLDAPDADEARQIVEEGRIIVTGSLITLNGTTGYQIKMAYYYDTNSSSPYYDPNGTKLMVDDIGVWLSGGFHYVPGSGNLAAYDSTPDVTARCGGEAVVWDIRTLFRSLPGGTTYPLTKTVNFKYTGPPGQAPSALSWVETSRVSDLTLSWDADLKPYRITSLAGGTIAEAYAIKAELRKLGSAVEGDYAAVGNTLMTNVSGTEYRSILYEKSSATVASDRIPASATVEAAFLYWSGWIDFHYCNKTGRFSYSWKDIPGLKYSNDTTPDKHILINQSARVDTVMFGTGSNMTLVRADTWQVEENIEQDDTWSYACFADVTSKVRGLIASREVGANGAGTYVMGHAVKEARPGYPEYTFTFTDTGASTGYPLGTPAKKCGSEWNYPDRYMWAYGGWSLIIIYSSPDTLKHQLYIFDKFAYAAMDSNVDFDDDGTSGGNISGFLVPASIASEDYAANLTCFVGEGDEKYKPDRVKLNGVILSNPPAAPSDNVWNGKSPGVSISGIDIDTFNVGYPTIKPGDTSAKVDLPTTDDSWNLIYIILSFRSEITTGGTINYLIR